MLSREREVTAGGIRFVVRVPWGRMRTYLKEVADAEAATLSHAARELAIDEATRRFLADVVVGWVDVAGPDGSAVTYRPELLDELDAAVVAELVRAIGQPPEEIGIKKEASG